jgi:hypothetical protein
VIAARAGDSCRLAELSFAATLAVFLLSCKGTPGGPVADAGGPGISDGRQSEGESGGPVSEWANVVPGSCAVAIATNPVAMLPPLQWVPCSNGAPSCQEMVHTWPSVTPPYVFGFIQASHDAAGSPALLLFVRALSGTLFEEDVYDLRTDLPIGGLQHSGTCTFGGSIGATTVDAIGFTAIGGASMLGFHGPAASLPQLTFSSIGGTTSLLGFQSLFASDTLVAFDSPVAGAIVRWPVASSNVVISKTPHVPILLDLVEQNDVYAVSDHGTTGWQQEYEVSTDGTVTLYRSESAAHVTGFATDGTTMFWSESSGGPVSTYSQPSVSVWSAPYTNNPAQLTATGQALATLPVSFTPGQAVAFQGLYATAPNPFNVAYVVGLTGATIRAVPAGPNRTFHTLALVSSSEVWAVMDSGAGQNGVALARYAVTSNDLVGRGVTDSGSASSGSMSDAASGGSSGATENDASASGGVQGDGGQIACGALTSCAGTGCCGTSCQTSHIVGFPSSTPTFYDCESTVDETSAMDACLAYTNSAGPCTDCGSLGRQVVCIHQVCRWQCWGYGGPYADLLWTYSAAEGCSDEACPSLSGSPGAWQ